MKTLTMNFSTTYPIYIGHDLFDTPLIGEYCSKLHKKLVIITDSNLIHSLGKNLQHKLQKQGISTDLLSFPAGEIHKTREIKQLLEDALFEKQYGRDTCLIALGGGVVTDLVGFLAATYCRGIPVIYIPTTLLAMVDASIGGKTGVNTYFGKNLVGTFTQPHAVFIDTATLSSLPENEFHNGMVEMIKHSVIADNTLFETLQNHTNKIKQRDNDFLTDMIYASCLIKKEIVEQDEKEQKGIRELLNFGHTIGHVIETIENYRISHGEAVAIGMLVESHLSIQHGFLEESAIITLKNLLLEYGLPLQTSAFNDKHTFQKLLRLDKKSIGNIAHFILLDKIGKPHTHQNAHSIAVDPKLLNQTIDWAKETFV